MLAFFLSFSVFLKISKKRKHKKHHSRFWQYLLAFLMIFKGPKVVSPNECRTFLDQKGSPRDPRGDQKGAKKDPRAEKVTFQKHKFSVSKTILFDARGSQKAPQGAPKATSKFEEKTKTKKRAKRASQGRPPRRKGRIPQALWIGWAPGAAP